MKIISTNKKAYADYFIIETYEAGIELRGTEVKSLREGGANFKDSFCKIKNGEVYLLSLHISPYKCGNIYNHDPERDRKLLLHKYEIRKIIGKVKEQGYTIVPTKLYFSDKGLVKVEIALAKGKKFYDKREDIRKKEVDRKIQEYVKRNR